jgi:ABC-type glycerol-3-phosphate transport system substrate-binding protein
MKRPCPPQPILEKVRLVCLDLPEVREERAWAGVRWVVSKKNFAHVVWVERGWPPAYARALGSDGPACVLTFRVPKLEASAPRFTKEPFFKPPWFSNIVGLVVGDDTDWDEAGVLLRKSFKVLAPAKLATQVEP